MLERRICEHLASTRYEDLPPEAIQATKNSIIDTVGVILASTATSQDVRRLRDLVCEQGGTPESTLIGYGDKVPAAMAALVNGAACHPLDFDDTHEPSKCHTSAASLPAALALAQRGSLSGKMLMRAAALGSDLAARIAGAVTLGPTQHGWMNTAVYGHLGGAAAAGCALNLDTDGMMAALGIAFCQTGGSREIASGSYRGIRDGFPQKVGVMSALLAQKGMTGPSEFLTGRFGLYPLYFKGKYTPDTLTDELGTRFEGVNVSYKFWPSCKLTHTYMESLIGIMTEEKVPSDEIDRVRIRVSEWGLHLCEPAEIRYRPQSEMSARDSFPFTLGLAMVKGHAEIADFAGPALADEAVLAAGAKVTHEFDPALDPSAMSPGDVTVETRDGRTFKKVVTKAYGSPQNPMRPADLHAKFRQCAQFADVSESRADAFLERVDALEREANVADLYI